MLKVDAIGHRQTNIDHDGAICADLSKDLVDPQPRQSQLIGDFLLGHASNEIEPCYAGAGLLRIEIIRSHTIVRSFVHHHCHSWLKQSPA